jgi:RNA polymerase primary sigma factor
LNTTTGATARPLSQFLRLAVVTGISRAVQVHIDRGDDLNACDGNGQTPLMLAAARNKAAICKLLLDAGADGSLQDPAGKKAHDIAIAAGAQDAAAVMAAYQVQLQEKGLTEFEHDFEAGSRADLPEQDSPDIAAEEEGNSNLSTAGQAIGVAEPTSDPDFLSSIPAAPPHGKELAQDRDDAPVLPTKVGNEQIPPALDQDDDLEFDLSGWVAEEESVAPAEDPTIAVAAVALQTAISLHTPIDSSDEWDDINVFLPDRVTPLSRAADTETRSHLRALLLRTIRERVASDREIDELSVDEDGAPNSEARALLLRVVNDLGAEVDDWLGPNPSQDNADHNAPAESAEEEALLDEAFSFIDAASSHRNEPLRAYQREFQVLPLITADEEISLAQTMERSLEAALDALAAWPAGIAHTLSAGAKVAAGLQPISWMSRGDAEPDPEGDGALDVLHDKN